MIRYLARLARVLCTGSAFFVFWSGGAFLTWVVLPIIRFRHRRDLMEAMRRCRRVLNRSLRLHADYMQFLRLIEFDSRAAERQLPSGGFVMVANHPSLIDVVLLLSTYPTLYCVVKGSVMRSPFIGSMLRSCNHIDAGDGDPVSGAKVVEGAIERLRSGDPVLIFPEGTRSPENGLGPFKKGAFAIAQAANVPVIPIRIHCHPPGLMRGQKWYQVPDGTMHYSLTFFPPCSPVAYAGGAAAMARDVRSLFLRPKQPVDMTLPSKHASPAFELELKHLIVDALMLKDQRPEDIDSTAPLFVEGLGLDSIDALELAMAIGKRYGVKFTSDDATNRQTFANVRSLAAYVAKMASAPAVEDAR